jgi:hypothetical protein
MTRASGSVVETLGGGPDPHPVLGDAIERDQPGLHEPGHVRGELAIEPVGVVGAEVGQEAVIDRGAAADPAIHHVAAGRPRQLAGAADALGGGVEPQRHEDARVDGVAAGVALDGLDPAVQGGEVGGAGGVPDGADGMVVGDELVERVGPELDLIAAGGLVASPPAALGPVRRGGRARLLGDLEQRGLGHARSRRVEGRALGWI